MRTHISATLSGVEHGMAILSLEDGQTLKVAREELNPLPEIGSAMGILVAPAAEMELEKEALAKHLLNQLLGNHE